MKFNSGLNYLQFKNTREKNSDLEMISQKEIMQTDFFNFISNSESLNEIVNLKEDIYIGVFSSPKCPDSATAVPLLLNLCSLNNKIQVKFFKKDDYSSFLETNLKEVKVPTILNLSQDNEILAKYCEFPCSLKEILSSKEFREDADSIIEDFRSGQYNNDLLKSLIKVITGINEDNYITFDKTQLPYRNLPEENK